MRIDTQKVLIRAIRWSTCSCPLPPRMYQIAYGSSASEMLMNLRLRFFERAGRQ